MTSLTNTALRRLADIGDVPGIAVATLEHGTLTRQIFAGTRSTLTPNPVDEDTVFSACSLSKTVFAHVVLQLVDAGLLSLETRLAEHLPAYIPYDTRSHSITVAHALSHACGLPNWRGIEYPLIAHFEPGERFSYSGEGMLYLQSVVELLSGENLEDLARRLVFEPFGMQRSSYIWQTRFEANRALSHDEFGRHGLTWKSVQANGATSLLTTAADFGRFLEAVLVGARLSRETAHRWLHPHVEVRHRGIHSVDPDLEEIETGVSWGLGWGLEPDIGRFFHWGDSNGFKAFTIGSIADQAAVAIFTNGAGGMAIMPDLLAELMPGEQPALAWLDYERCDAPRRRLLRACLEHGAEVAWNQETASLDADDHQWLVHGLEAHGRLVCGQWLRAWLKAGAGEKIQRK